MCVAAVGSTLVVGIVVKFTVFPVEADISAPDIVISPITAQHFHQRLEH